MAELSTKLKIENNNGEIKECTLYTTEQEATPVSKPGGDCWKIIVNDTIEAYIGMYPKDIESNYKTDLVLTKNNIDYYAQTKVVNIITVNIVQSEHQLITVTCNGNKYTESFEVLADTPFTAEIKSIETGWTAGALNYKSGFTGLNLIIKAHPATRSKYYITVPESEDQVPNIVVTPYNGGDPVTFTGSFTANHGDTFTANMILTGSDAQYKEAGKITPASGTITEAFTFNIRPVTTVSGTVDMDSPQKGTVYVNNRTDSFTYTRGTNLTVSVGANSGFTPYLIAWGEYKLIFPETTTNQRLKVVVNSINSNITETFSETCAVDEGDTFEAFLIADDGYDAGTVTPSSGTVHGDINFIVTEATIKEGE